MIATAIVASLMASFVLIGGAQSRPPVGRKPARADLTAAEAPPTQTATPSPSPSPSPTPSPSPSPAAPAQAAPTPTPSPKPTPKPTPKAPAPASKLVAYQGLGAWVSLYDFVLTTKPIDPAIAVGAMAQRKVQTLYLQTSRWNLPDAITGADLAAQFIEAAHAHGIKVVGWYLPGFADVNLDVSRSVAVLKFTTPKGQHFDGLAPDIEDKNAVNHNIAAFNAGIIAYSRALRGAVGAGQPLGAIVPDAVNNRRYPQGWVGFPWTEIARNFDVVMPMGYWSVTKPRGGCATQYDAGAYTRDVVATTTSLMGASKPMLVVGGVGDCDTLAEVQGYVAATKSLGTLGASIYSFMTVQNGPNVEGFWKALQTARR